MNNFCAILIFTCLFVSLSNVLRLHLFLVLFLFFAIIRLIPEFNKFVNTKKLLGNIIVLPKSFCRNVMRACYYSIKLSLSSECRA